MHFFKSACAAATLLLAIVATCNAEPGAPLYRVEAYAKLPRVMQPSLSGDGKTIAYLTAVTSGRKTLVAHPLTGAKNGRSFSLPHLEGADISRFRWVNNDRILVTYSFFKENVYYAPFPIEQTRLFSVSLDGDVFNAVKPSAEQKRLLSDTSNPLSSQSTVSIAQIQSRIVDMLWGDKDHVLLALDENLDGDPGVRRINVNTGAYDIVRKDRDDINRWLTNASGEPVLGWATYEEQERVFISGAESDIWSQSAILGLLEQGAYPIEVQDDNVTAFFRARNESGMRSLGLFDLRTGKAIKWLHSDDKYDYAGLYRSSITGKINGITFVDTKTRQVFLDGKENQILRVINKALPNTNNRILSSDASGSIFLIHSHDPQRTPKIFLFDLTAKTLSVFANLHGDIQDGHVAPVERKIAKMRDGLPIEVYITSPIGSGDEALPTVLMPHGGPTARDSADFHWRAQMLANRGYRVLQPNFRGSSGYGARFEVLGHGEWGKAMQTDLEDTMTWAIAQGLSETKNSCIVGGSYGGYAALMAAVATPDLFSCAVSINGVADMRQFWTEQDQWKGGEEWRKPIGEKRRDTKDISPYQRADEIKIPVLLIHAKDDARIDYRQSKTMYKRLKRNKTPVQYVELGSGGHGVDVDVERVKYNKALVAFLDKYIGEGR